MTSRLAPDALTGEVVGSDRHREGHGPREGRTRDVPPRRLQAARQLRPLGAQQLQLRDVLRVASHHHATPLQVLSTMESTFPGREVATGLSVVEQRLDAVRAVLSGQEVPEEGVRRRVRGVIRLT